ncbi:MAG TPA: low molecular weight protein arginine phosphatase [Elusimicrobia bacterium]|nr:low molecular weight protein arginine phosphatase [Elusimicrobiota bacterium]
MKVLFVCTGNMCRSPAAEKLLRHYGAGRGFEARSRGLGVQPHYGLHRKMAALLKEEGVANLEHKASLVTEPDVDWADLVVAMEEGQLDALGELFPQSLRKSRLLLDGEDLEDPIHQDDAKFRAVFEKIKAAVKKLIGD